MTFCVTSAPQPRTLGLARNISHSDSMVFTSSEKLLSRNRMIGYHRREENHGLVASALSIASATDFSANGAWRRPSAGMVQKLQRKLHPRVASTGEVGLIPARVKWE